jgi:hypothetical protein
MTSSPGKPSRPSPWVGDTVYDPVEETKAIVTDVFGTEYMLRPPHNMFSTWIAQAPERLELIARNPNLQTS